MTMLKHKTILLVLLCLSMIFVLVSCQNENQKKCCDSEKWQKLFNGKDLQGFHALPGGKWQVKDGVLVGTSTEQDKNHGLLVTDKTYSDFTLRLKFKITEGDSGVYFRMKETGDKRGGVGFQAEIDTSYETGGLYETGGRGWVVKPDPEYVKKFYTIEQWSEMLVKAKGSHIQIFINGNKVTDIIDTQGSKEGHIALQLHSDMKMHIEAKDIEIKL